MKKIAVLISVLVTLALLITPLSAMAACPDQCECGDMEINLSPISGPVGTTVTLTGNISENCGEFQVYWGDACGTCDDVILGDLLLLAAGYADNHDEISGDDWTEVVTTFNVPRDYNGTHNVYLIDVENSDLEANDLCCISATFDVECSLKITRVDEVCDVKYVNPGDKVRIVGNGFPKNGPVDIYLGDCECEPQVKLGTHPSGNNDDDGRFVKVVTIPEDTEGGMLSIVAVGCCDVECCAKLWITGQGIEVSPNSVDPGEEVTVTGNGWGPDPCCNYPQRNSDCTYEVELWMGCYCFEQCDCGQCEGQDPCWSIEEGLGELCDTGVLLGTATPDECGDIDINVTIPDCIECGACVIVARAVCACEADCQENDTEYYLKQWAYAPVLVGTDIWLETGNTSGTFFILGDCFPLHWPFNVCDYYPGYDCNAPAEGGDCGDCGDCNQCPPKGLNFTDEVNDLYFTFDGDVDGQADREDELFAIDMSEQAYLCNYPLYEPGDDYWDVIEKLGGDLGKFLAISLVPAGTDPGTYEVGVHMLNVWGTGIDIHEYAEIVVEDSAGTQGPQGPKGDQGDKGDKGDQGDQGIQGPKGDQGDQGIQGTQGIQGIQGIQGVQGVQGIQGIQGVQGLPGECDCDNGTAAMSTDADDSGATAARIAALAGILAVIAICVGGLVISRARRHNSVA